MNKEFEKLIKFLPTIGYPSKRLSTLSSMIGYDLDNFLTDLVDAYGIDGAEKFCEKAIKSLSDKKGIKIPLELGEGSYVYLIIKSFRIDLEEDQEGIIARAEFGDSKIVHPEDGHIATLKQIQKDADMSEWSELEDFLQDVRSTASEYIRENCGFYLWYDYQ